eukprot:9471005-Pyramimonas_sp.AAC.1
MGLVWKEDGLWGPEAFRRMLVEVPGRPVQPHRTKPRGQHTVDLRGDAILSPGARKDFPRYEGGRGAHQAANQQVQPESVLRHRNQREGEPEPEPDCLSLVISARQDR